jgi:hypothetical protein
MSRTYLKKQGGDSGSSTRSTDWDGSWWSGLVLFCITVLLLYFVLQRKCWASTLGMIYAIIMIANGIGHNLGMLVTGRYFGGEAFGFTGIGLVLIGLPLLYTLWQDMPREKSSRTAITPSLFVLSKARQALQSAQHERGEHHGACSAIPLAGSRWD